MLHNELHLLHSDRGTRDSNRIKFVYLPGAALLGFPSQCVCLNAETEFCKLFYYIYKQQRQRTFVKITYLMLFYPQV